MSSVRNESTISAKSRLRRAVRDFLYAPVVKKPLLKIPVIRGIYPRWERTHPIDAYYGIDTSGVVRIEELCSDKNLLPLINPYAGSQPSIARAGLAALGNVEGYAFIDLGCGKGRVTAIASEFPFREAMGVELSARLADIARANAATIARRFPDRPRIKITEANVADFPLPPGKLVFFNYHAFGSALVAQMVKKIEAALGAGAPHVFFVYYNPVHAEYLDASPAFTRYYAERIPYDKSELGFGPDKEDTVVIWQSVRGSLPVPHKQVDRKIVIAHPLSRAELA